jgi:hypothetical protein
MSDNIISAAPAQRAQLRKTLTLVPVVMMGLAYLQPMTIFDTFGIVSGLTDGHVATAYAFALLAVLFTALSYGKLVRKFPSAGSAYTYAQKAISPHVGFMVGWSSLLGLPVHADDQHSVGKNLPGSHLPGRAFVDLRGSAGRADDDFQPARH